VVIVDKTSFGDPSTLLCSTSTLAALYRIDHSHASAAFSCGALICLSCVCHSDWQDQISDVAA
jgi:hypothetical protein